MIELNAFLNEMTQALDRTFGNRVWFFGLQGSYARGEATETSDIDPVVILDELSPEDIAAYRSMLDSLPHRELLCGFLSGREELLNWEPSDLFQFYHDTRPIRGSLDGLLPLLDRNAVVSAVKIGAGNLYHGCVHNLLHERSEEILRGLYKSAVFTLQALRFLETGMYLPSGAQLLQALSGEDRAVLEIALRLKKGGEADFDRMSQLLFSRAKHWILLANRTNSQEKN